MVLDYVWIGISSLSGACVGGDSLDAGGLGLEFETPNSIPSPLYQDTTLRNALRKMLHILHEESP